ncbi:MAG TPA: ABC transporter substrate-binding protein [Syntrophorhabdales bacterium]|nr:ABC transporter substrate-binding protein [Syntrophorhabdales bacterium]
MGGKECWNVGVSAIVLSCLLLLCGVSEVAAQKKPVIRLGVNLDVTGYGAWLGEPELRAVQLFAEQINGRGGIDNYQLELVVYDNESNPEKSSTNAKKLIQRDKVAAILGTAITATSNAAKSVAQEEKVVTYSLSGSYEPSYADSFTFATWVHTSGMVETIYDYFAKNGIKRVAALCATDSTGQTWLDEANRSAKKYGFEIASERFNVKDVDVTAQLAKLKATNPQALIVGVSGAPNAVVAKNFNQMGFKIPYVTGHGNISDTFLKLMEGNEPETLLLPGAYYIVWRELPDAYPQKKLMKEFTEAFQKKFKKEADIYAVVAYDAARVIAEGVRQVKPEGPKDSQKLRDAMELMKNFPAVYGGTYTFSKEDHRGIKKDAALMIQVKGGKFVMAK